MTETITETVQKVKIGDFNPADINMEELPEKRYEIQIKQDHFNYYFGITEVTFLAYNIMVAHSHTINKAPMGGVYKTIEEAVGAAIMYLEKQRPEAEIIVSAKIEKN